MTDSKEDKWYYRILGGILDGVARLPLGVLYVLSDILFFIIYYVIRYRRRVVADNIAGSFPEMDSNTRRKVERDFYRHFADYIVETIKLPRITDDEMRRRMEFVDIDIVDRLWDEGRSIAAYFSHCGNWEWGTSITLWTKRPPEVGGIFAQVYRPLRNQWFDRYFLHLRSRFHSRSFTKASVFRDLMRLRREPIPSITGFMSDQKPSLNEPLHVVSFLNRPTAIITGTETVARKLGMAVVYMDMEKPRRGHYRITMRLITEDASQTDPLSVTDSYASMLQDSIRRTPHIWLWTHKRWKHPVSFDQDNTASKTVSDNDNRQQR
ncbi:MAG: lysophospholipid acyltransferase family protein [Pseudoflavonifractor sp.]|nr:lysophospholipid acyltransferase family protein [Pseudoflavonifractor sp.]